MFGQDSYVHLQSSFPFVDVYLHGDTNGGVFTPQFSLGHSYHSQQPVKTIIFDRLPATALLVAGAVILWLAIAIPIGIISAVKRRSFLDRTTMVTIAGLHLGAGLLARTGGALPVRPGRRA